jgi:hypothetical protein
MSGDVTKLVSTVELDRAGCIVIIELHCTDELAAVVLREDLAEKIMSGRGLQLSLRGRVASEGGAS